MSQPYRNWYGCDTSRHVQTALPHVSGAGPIVAIMSTPTSVTSRLIGLDIVDRDTDQVVHTVTFTPDEATMPGYVESVIGGYAHTPQLEPVKVWRSRVNPNEVAKAVEAMCAAEALLYGMHETYSRVVMETEDDRDEHDRSVRAAGEALAQARLLLDRVDARLRITD